MKKIRISVFETNSSSTHSLTIVSKEDFEKWKKGEFIFDRSNDELVPVKEKQYTEEDYLNYLKDKAKKVANGYIFRDVYYKNLDEILSLNLISNDEMNEYLEDEGYDYDFQTYKDWENDEYLETFQYSHTTPSGDEIVVFGRYGYDG